MEVEGKTLPDEDHIKRMYYYSFCGLLVLIGLRLVHFQVIVLLSDVLTAALIWIAVCTMNKYVCVISLVNAVVGFAYAIFEIFEYKSVKSTVSIVLLILIILFALISYALDCYASYYGYQVFSVSFQNNMNNEGSPPGYGAIGADLNQAKGTLTQ